MRWTIGRKLSLGFGTVLILLVVVATLGFMTTKGTIHGYEGIMNVEVKLMEHAANVDRELWKARRREKDFMLRDNIKYVAKAREHIAKLNEEATQLLETKKAQGDMDGVEKAQEILTASGVYLTAFNQIVDSKVRKGLDPKSGLQGTFRKAAHAVEKEIKNLNDKGLEVDYLMMRRHEKDYLLRGLDKYVEAVKKDTTNLKRYINSIDINSSRKAKISKFLDEYQKSFDALVAENQVIAKLGSVLSNSATEIASLVQANIEDIKKEMTEASEHTSKSANSKNMIAGIVSFLAVVIGVVFAWFISKMISTPMIIGANAAQKISQGDLSQYIDVTQDDEIGDLANALNYMVKNLRDTMVKINDTAEQVSSGSEEISSSAENLSQAATEQAASLEETSAAVEELNSSIEQNAENAKEASKLSTEAVNVATTGGQNVENMVNSMVEIDASAKKIAEIISVIDDIADQTNLLALNAAIEAARAGEQGKGFAVVAVEVRKLAERSQQAAQEIATLIKESVKKTEEGSTIANKSGETLAEIIKSVQKVADLVQNINASSQEQANGADQIAKAIEQLNQVTQTNSATSEESASASQQLASQAQMLQDLIAFFELGKEATKKANGNSKGRTPTKHINEVKHIETRLAVKEPAQQNTDETFDEF